MPRGFKKDVTTTKILRANNLLLDNRSFISLGVVPHLLLKGDDVVCQRQRVWLRSKGICAECGWNLHVFSWDMDHIKYGLVERCDCLHNLRAIHKECHRKKHVQPKFSKKEALKDFEKLYPTGE